MKDKLTARQVFFVSEYCVDQNGKQAAIRAGYSETSAETEASRLLAKPHIRAAVDAKLSKLIAKVDITAEYVLGTLKEIVERCMKRQGIDKFDPYAANKSLELLGKHIKLFTDKVEHSGAVDLTKVIELAQESSK